ncbi:DUF5318 family protein [Nonomuraea sp. NEAU-A123]|uniref:DUF5318 family protein n=1 Tax=Nonomuraea sp. NEAU-A123 TaxID=2839649 RepID=UPI0027E0AB99|nr:DUF5318 family protein [Nonomuraea sp. NEAU-A123]
MIRRAAISPQLTTLPSRWDDSAKRRSLALMWSQRRVVDYGLVKRAVVEPLRSGRTSPGAVCDAQPYLLRAARHFGEPTEHLCPGCERENVTNVTYVYGDSLKSQSGAAKIASQPAEMAHDYDEFRVYVVEVCQGCSWNHLTASFVLGNGPPDLVGRP